MNRKQRRQAGIKSKVPTYNLTKEQIDKLKHDITDEAMEKAFKVMIGLPVMIIHDKFDKLIPEEVNGIKREERFTDMLLDWYDSINKDLVSFNDMLECLEEECGIRFEKEWKK